MSKEPEIKKERISGDRVADLFPEFKSEKVTVEWNDKEVEFEVMPIDNETYSLIGDKIKISDVDFENSKNSLVGMKALSDMYYPAIRVVLPKCCVTPKVIDGVSTDKKVLPVNRIPLDVCIQLLDKILKMSGVLGKAIEDRKK